MSKTSSEKITPDDEAAKEQEEGCSKTHETNSLLESCRKKALEDNASDDSEHSDAEGSGPSDGGKKKASTSSVSRNLWSHSEFNQLHRSYFPCQSVMLLKTLSYNFKL